MLSLFLAVATATDPTAWWASVGAWKEAAKPPEFGHPMLAEFDLDPQYTNVNQGSYGSTPRKVRMATESLVVTAEANPDRWFRNNLTGTGNSLYIDQLIETRKALARYIRAPLNETSIVDNASHGINAVLRSVPAFLTKKGILFLDLAYGEVKGAMQFMGGTYPAEPTTSPGNKHPLVEVDTSSLGVDIANPAKLVPLVEAALRQAGGTIGLCSFSHIVSTPGIILPVKELSAACKAAGALTMIDGAHAPGNIALDVPAIGADFYVGNGHKHLYTSRGVCLLWARSSAQKYLYPLVIDEGGVGTTFEKYFMYQGTSDDVTRYISLRAALEWREYIGGEQKILEYTHRLAEEACAYLSSLWGTRRLAEDVQANMCNVELPCGGPGMPACPDMFGYALYHEYNFYLPIGAWLADGTWARITCSVYNQMSDIEAIGKAVLAALDQHR